MKRIVTGQQIGLFGGAVFILYKILGVIQEAKQKKLIPCFWMETNDADFEEINKINYLNAKGEIKTLRWQKNTAGTSIGKMIVDKNLLEIINFFFSDLQQTSHTFLLQKIVLNCYQEGKNLADCYQQLIQILFKNYPLEIFNPNQKEFLNFSQPILKKELLETAINSQAKVFIAINDKRIALFKNEHGEFVNRKGKKINLEQGILLPSVHNRSLLQDLFLETDTYICGENEEKYLINLKEIYQKYNASFPLLKKRMSAICQDFFFEEEFFQKVQQDRDLELTKKKILFSIGFDKKKITDELNSHKQELINQLKKQDLPSKEIEKFLYVTFKKMIKEKQKNIKIQHQKELNAIEKTYLYYYPQKQHQERFYHLFYYLNLYGLDLIENVYRHYSFDKDILLKF